MFECQSANMLVRYEKTDESFDHSFGTRKLYGHKINKIEVYVPAIGDWIDVTNLNDKKINSEAERIVERHMSS